MRVNGEDHMCLANAAADLVELGKVTDALVYARKACELAPLDPIDLNTLANIYLMQGNAVEAIPVLQRILALEGNGFEEIQERATNNLRAAQACLADTTAP
jgi:predicted Zn-dependent protease